MKCPKCSYTSFDYLNACSRCGTDLRDVRTLLQIIAVSPEERAPGASEPLPEPLAAARGSAGAEFNPEEPREVSFDDLSFDSSFDDLVEHTSYADTKAASTAAPKSAEDDILDLDFGDIFGDKSGEDKA